MLTTLFLFTLITGAVSAAGIVTKNNVVGTNHFSTKYADFLYIGDWGSNPDNNPVDSTVKRFNVNSGNFVGNFVNSNSGGLHGPTGILFERSGQLLVSNQNTGLTINGDVLQYNGKKGFFITALVNYTDKHAPLAPQGIILKDSKLYVADLGDTGIPGNVSVYNLNSGKFLKNLAPDVFQNPYYHPRGLVFGPDGYLYVSVRDLGGIENHIMGNGGSVLRFKPDGRFDKVFITDKGGAGHLNRPEGLVFGPDKNLYITSFRNDSDSNDTDSIRIYNGKTGKFLRKINLETVDHPDRAYAQALLFGPNGRLFVPITNTGEVRRYNVHNGKYDSIVKAGGELKSPWFLTFGKTNPTTLAYHN